MVVLNHLTFSMSLLNEASKETLSTGYFLKDLDGVDGEFSIFLNNFTKTIGLTSYTDINQCFVSFFVLPKKMRNRKCWGN